MSSIKDEEDPEFEKFWEMLEESCRDLNNEFWSKSGDCKKNCSTCKTCNLCKHYSLLNEKCEKHNSFKKPKDSCNDWAE